MQGNPTPLFRTKTLASTAKVWKIVQISFWHLLFLLICSIKTYNSNANVMKNLKKTAFALAVSSCQLFSSCGGDDDVNPELSAGGMNFGKVTSAVVVVNPVINEGSSTTVPSGTSRGGIQVQVGELEAVATDNSGLAVINGIPVGSQSLTFKDGSLDFEVANQGELYDMIVSYTDGVAYIVPVVRYPIGGAVTVLKPGDDLAAAASTDNAILFLEVGTYPGDVLVSGENVLIFGTWDPVEGPKSVIEGNLTFNGGAGRIRGLQVNQTITVNANSFSAAFSNFNNAELKGNGMVLLRNKFSGESVVVPSSSAVLVDNIGIQ